MGTVWCSSLIKIKKCSLWLVQNATTSLSLTRVRLTVLECRSTSALFPSTSQSSHLLPPSICQASQTHHKLPHPSRKQWQHKFKDLPPPYHHSIPNKAYPHKETAFEPAFDVNFYYPTSLCHGRWGSFKLHLANHRTPCVIDRSESVPKLWLWSAGDVQGLRPLKFN